MAIAEQQSRRHFDLQSAAAAPPPSRAHLAQICSWQIQSQGAAVIGAIVAILIGKVAPKRASFDANRSKFWICDQTIRGDFPRTDPANSLIASVLSFQNVTHSQTLNIFITAFSRNERSLGKQGTASSTSVRPDPAILVILRVLKGTLKVRA